MGKSFRNEITKGNFISARSSSNSAEIEYFFDPEVADLERALR